MGRGIPHRPQLVVGFSFETAVGIESRFTRVVRLQTQIGRGIAYRIRRSRNS